MMSAGARRDRRQQFERDRTVLHMRAAVLAAVAPAFVDRMGSSAVSEAVDEALAQIVAAEGHLGDPDAVKALWITCARRRLIDEQRSAEVRHRALTAGDDAAAALADSVWREPTRLTEDERQWWRIREILGVLRGEQRVWAEAWYDRVLSASRVSGGQPRGLAEALGWTPAKTKSVSRRARMRMAAFIEDRVSGVVCEEQRRLMDDLIVARRIRRRDPRTATRRRSRARRRVRGVLGRVARPASRAARADAVRRHHAGGRPADRRSHLRAEGRRRRRGGSQPVACAARARWSRRRGRSRGRRRHASGARRRRSASGSSAPPPPAARSPASCRRSSPTRRRRSAARRSGRSPSASRRRRCARTAAHDPTTAAKLAVARATAADAQRKAAAVSKVARETPPKKVRSSNAGRSAASGSSARRERADEFDARRLYEHHGRNVQRSRVGPGADVQRARPDERSGVFPGARHGADYMRTRELRVLTDLDNTRQGAGRRWHECSG